MSEAPFVSVLMPVRNESVHLMRTLEAVLGQDYPRDRMEIVLADGMSTDGTRDLLAELAKKHSNIRVVDNPGQIAPTGWNAAAKRAKGEILVRVDGHCVIAPDYVSQCVRHLATEGVDAVGGPVETIADTPAAEAIALAMNSRFGVGGAAFRIIKDRPVFVDTIIFPAYPRSVIDRIGWFDEELVRNQDDEYNCRLREAGGKILLSPDVRSKIYSRGSLSKMSRQYYQYGYWKVRVMQKHPMGMKARHFAPPLFVFSLLLLTALAPFMAPARWGLAGLTALYAACNLLASALMAAQHGWRHFPRLPIVIATLHVSYGLGFLVGLCVFWNRWGDRANRFDSVNVENQTVGTQG